MNKLGKTRATAISMSFHKNVFLLTQMVPPPLEFQQHFKKGMFDKPNVAGFIQVSYYLSVIYDVKLFKQMVKWPIFCKRDEITYRSEIKNFLSVLSRDNPDINFPPILTSHLILSGGIKFLIVMWKLSQLTLRTYIKRQPKINSLVQKELLSAPHTSRADDLTVMHFRNIIAEEHNSTRMTYEKADNILSTANNFLKNENVLLYTYKSETFDRKENLKRLVFDKSVHPLAQERLMNVEDVHIIELWKKHILTNLQYTRKQINELNEAKEISSRLRKLIFRINSHSKVLDANSLPKINNDNYLLRSQNLYVNGFIAFSTLLSLVTLACPRMLQCVNLDSTVSSLPDLSQCLPYVQNASKYIKCLQALFTALDVKLTGMFTDEQRVPRRISNVSTDPEVDSTFIAKWHALLQSPKINFCLDKCEDDFSYEKLCPSLVKDKHEYLFKKYKYKRHSSYEWFTTSPIRNNSPQSRWLSPRTHFTKYEQVTFKGKSISPIYFKLLQHHKLSLKRPRENLSHSPCYKEQKSSKRRHTISGHLTRDAYLGKPRILFNSAISPSCAC